MKFRLMIQNNLYYRQKKFKKFDGLENYLSLICKIKTQLLTHVQKSKCIMLNFYNDIFAMKSTIHFII